MNQFLAGNFILCFEPIITLDLDHVTAPIQSQTSWAYFRQKRIFITYFQIHNNFYPHNKHMK